MYVCAAAFLTDQRGGKSVLTHWLSSWVTVSAQLCCQLLFSSAANNIAAYLHPYWRLSKHNLIISHVYAIYSFREYYSDSGDAISSTVCPAWFWPTQEPQMTTASVAWQQCLADSLCEWLWQRNVIAPRPSWTLACCSSSLLLTHPDG